MIKLSVGRKQLKKIRDMHINYLKQFVLDRIGDQISNYKSEPGYLELLGYFCVNLERILGGEKEDLRRIIREVEENYYISDKKLNSILASRESLRGYSDSEKRDYLIRFSIQNNISNYIVEDRIYNSVELFNGFIKDLKQLNKKMEGEN